MNKLFIDKEINVFYSGEADKRLKEKNDLKYFDENFHGIHKVDIERWQEAQFYEKKTWMNKGIFISDDRNHDHLKRFNDYIELQNHFFKHKKNDFSIIELGCGPFTNIRLLLEKFKYFNFEKISLLDPLISEYLEHPNCFYKNKKVYEKEATIHCSSIEDFVTEEKYDLLLITNVLEHCYDIDKIFTKIIDLLKKDGILIFSDVFFKGVDALQLAEKIYDAGHPLKLSEDKMKIFLSNFEPLLDNEFKALYEQEWRNDKYFIGIKK
jgi:SAM-dependent methyltransferase